MKTVLTIAGSDSCGGAGIQADLKTMCALGVYGMTAVTAVTVQNTLKVYDVQEISPDVVAGQIDAVFADIPPDAVKIGMVSDAGIIRVIRERLLFHKARNIVVDPVMVSKSGYRLLREEAELAIRSLIQIAEVVTPNIPEAELLTGLRISGSGDMLNVARELLRMGAGHVLLKGGHLEGDADDLLLCGEEALWLRGPRIKTKNTHGTGCTLSSAIACFLARGRTVPQAAQEAKAYVTQAIRDALSIGKGVGPLGHMAALYREAKIYE